MGSEEERKVISNYARQRKIFYLFLIVACLAFFSFKEKTPSNPSKVNHAAKKSTPVDLSAFEKKCHDDMKFNVTAPEEYDTKPIWFASASHTLRADMHGTLINKMTGTKAGGKLYIRSGKNLKHCIGNGQSVTCVAEHENASNRKVGIFYNKYLMIVRNPLTGFPSSYNNKSKMYRGLQGQENIDTWRKVRDTYYEGVVKEFTKSMEGWKHTNFDVGMYIIFEDLYDIEKGIDTMKRLRLFLIDAGFQVVPEEELSCIWYLALGKEDIENFNRNGYEYSDYVPGYKEEQKSQLLQELQDYETTISNDADQELKTIVHRYISDIKENTLIDNVSAPTENEKTKE
mmetsp:Transcript_29006/g.43828  ORF Transcript_29006/g.43828 Transcript_29006/m.43828 type:complete len:343 (+) Transcript_29006:61-1089(+)